MSAKALAGDTRPSVILILVDDLGWMDLSETMPDKVAAVEALLDQRLKSQEANLPRPNPDYAGN